MHIKTDETKCPSFGVVVWSGVCHRTDTQISNSLNRRLLSGVWTVNSPQSHIVRVYDAGHGKSGVFHSAEWHDGDWSSDGIREAWLWFFIWSPQGNVAVEQWFYKYVPWNPRAPQVKVKTSAKGFREKIKYEDTCGRSRSVHKRCLGLSPQILGLQFYVQAGPGGCQLTSTLTLLDSLVGGDIPRRTLTQTSRREDRHIVRNARVQPTASSAAIQAQVAPSLGDPVSSRTVRRRLAEGH
ncbi:hypothetical protein TNCV_3022691 [Trichonephila clavipes]|nr:hypothetical protein TNCV_3022691 [Trichonephila clavipes]